jgi:1-acyl-sn-glycerol-3-phosphate acyltransferase
MSPDTLRHIVDWLFLRLTARQVEGLDRLPPAPYILATNHLSYLDVPLIYSYLGSDKLTAWVAEKYARHPIFRLIVRLGRGIYIQRGQIDRQALRAAVEVLRAGNIFGVSPEGTRSKTGRLMRAKTGAAYLAMQAQVPVVPVALTGTEAAVRKLIRLQRPELTIRFGRPFRLHGLEGAGRADSLRRATDEIMCRIACLLPPAYRGFYGDHPRLHELLSEIETS